MTLATALPILASALGTAPTVDANAIPVLSMTEVTHRPAHKALPECTADRGRDAEPARYGVRFSIEPDGSTSDVMLIGRLPDSYAQPCGGEALRAVRQWRFSPPTHEGRSVRIENVTTKIGFAAWGR